MRLWAWEKPNGLSASSNFLVALELPCQFVAHTQDFDLPKPISTVTEAVWGAVIYTVHMLCNLIKTPPHTCAFVPPGLHINDKVYGRYSR